jgi:hypothetical protein
VTLDIGARLELTEIPNTGAFQFTRGGSPADRTRTIQGSCAAARDHPARRGRYRQRRNDLPALRDLAAHLYRWLRRYQELGPEGLRGCSHRPLVCPHVTKAASAQPRSSPSCQGVSRISRGRCKASPELVTTISRRAFCDLSAALPQHLGARIDLRVMCREATSVDVSHFH